jgi:hypothetical protein
MPEVFNEASRLLVLNFMHELFRTKAKIDIDKFDEIAVQRTQKQTRIIHLVKEFLGFSSMLKGSKSLSVLNFVAKKASR